MRHDSRGKGYGMLLLQSLAAHKYCTYAPEGIPAAIVVFVVNPDLPRLQPARVRRRSNAEGHEHRRERSRIECCVHISSITWLQV